MTRESIIIDAHHHYCPAEAAQKLCVVDGMDYAGRMKERGSCYFQGQEIEGTLRLMDGAGIDQVVLNQAAWADCGLSICKEMNDAYARMVEQHPNKFIACAHVPLNSEPETIDELGRAVNVLRLKGVSLPASSAQWSLGSEKLFPLYEKISQMDLPIVIHPTVRTPLWGGTGMLMGSGVSREYDVAKSTVEVLNIVLQKFPTLRFLMPHYGGGMPWLKGRIMARFEPKGWNVPAAVKGAAKSPRELKELGLDKAFEEIFDKLYFDMAGSGGWLPNVKMALMAIRTDRLCFGTDYPFDIREPEDAKSYIDAVKKIGIPALELKNIFGGNVQRLFKI
jgi:predicted TIM-barrel fold metal-dependent hydrolase